MTAEQAATAAVVLGAAFAQGVIGFGFGLVVMSFLPRLLPLPQAVATTATCGLFVSLLLFWRYRREVLWREVGLQLAGAAVGLPLGVLALTSLDPDPCVRALGALIVGFVLWETWPSARVERVPVARAWAVPAGVLSGAFGGAFASGGPPVIAYGTARRFAPAAFKGVLQGYFSCATSIHLGLLAGRGILTGDVALRGLCLVPLVPLGTWLGARYGDRLHPEWFRRLVLAALLVLGVAYLALGR